MNKTRKHLLAAFDSLEKRRNNLEERLDKLPKGWLEIPEKEGKWSVNQVMAHLSDAEFGTLRYIGKKKNAIDSLKSSGLLSKIRYQLLKWLLDSPLRYKMPKQLPQPSTERSYEQLRQQFEKNRMNLKELIGSFEDEDLDKLIFRHPFAGRFSLYQTVRFMEDHFNHHMRQIDRILNTVGTDSPGQKP